MTDNLNQDSRDALVAYRLERAYKTLDEVEILLANNLFSTAINRLYYAVYYAAIALMVKDGLSATTHSGVRSMLGLHYIRQGKISRDIGSNYTILFERRHRSDYDDFIDTSREEVYELRQLAKSFVDAVKALIDGQD